MNTVYTFCKKQWRMHLMSKPALAKPVRLAERDAPVSRTLFSSSQASTSTVAEQRGVNLGLRFLAPNSDLIVEVDNPPWVQGAWRGFGDRCRKRREGVKGLTTSATERVLCFLCHVIRRLRTMGFEGGPKVEAA